MQYRNLGATGLKVSAISFGSYLTFGHLVDKEMAKKLMQMAYNAGVNLFDNAEVYALGKSELIMGEALKELGWPRETYVLMTKVFWGGPKPTQIGLHRKHIYDACHASLKALQVEYIDLFLCHRPDKNTPIEETVRSMHNLILQGKILYWGTSEWSALEVMEAIAIAEKYNLTPPSLEQFQYNMIARNKAEIEFLPLFIKRKLGITITMPLAGGLLTGKYDGQLPEGSRYHGLKDIMGNFMPLDQLESINGQLKKIAAIEGLNNITMAQIAIAWCLKNNNISSVIVGASNEQQLKENLQSHLFLYNFDNNVINNIEEILGNKSNEDCMDFFDYQLVTKLA